MSPSVGGVRKVQARNVFFRKRGAATLGSRGMDVAEREDV